MPPLISGGGFAAQIGKAIDATVQSSTNRAKYIEPISVLTFDLSQNGPFSYPSESANQVRAYVNPTTFTEKHDPQYSKRGPLGLSNEVPQYIRTNSREIAFTLWICQDVYVQLTDRGTDKRVLKPSEMRRFIQSLTVPLRRRMAPPTVELTWRGMDLAFVGKCSNCSFDYQRFNEFGEPIDYNVSLTFLEVGTGLMTSNLVYAKGMGYDAMEKSTDIGNI